MAFVGFLRKAARNAIGAAIVFKQVDVHQLSGQVGHRENGRRIQMWPEISPGYFLDFSLAAMHETRSVKSRAFLAMSAVPRSAWLSEVW